MSLKACQKQCWKVVPGMSWGRVGPEAAKRIGDSNLIADHPIAGGGAAPAFIFRFPVRTTRNGKRRPLMFVGFSRLSRFPVAINRTGDLSRRPARSMSSE
jgi:hypothetical protein